MKKEDLVAMGLTDDQAKKVMDSLDGNFVTKNRFNEVNEENKQLKTQIADRDKQLDDLKKSSGDNEALKQQIAALQQQNADAAAAHEQEITRLKLDNAVEAALSAAGARNNKAVRSLFDESKFKLTADGQVREFQLWQRPVELEEADDLVDDALDEVLNRVQLVRECRLDLSEDLLDLAESFGKLSACQLVDRVESSAPGLDIVLAECQDRAFDAAAFFLNVLLHVVP